MISSKSEEFLMSQDFWFCSWGLQITTTSALKELLTCRTLFVKNKTKLVQTRVNSLSGKYLQLTVWPRSLHSILIHRFCFIDTRLRGKEHFKHSSQTMYLLAKLAQKSQSVSSMALKSLWMVITDNKYVLKEPRTNTEACWNNSAFQASSSTYAQHLFKSMDVTTPSWVA